MVVQRGRLMKYSRLLFGPLTAAILSFSSLPAQAADLVNNGSFELDSVSGPYQYKLTLTGWTVSGGSSGAVLFDKAAYGTFSGGNYLGSDGDQAIQLELGGHYIQQTLSTVAGQQYQLTFDYSSYVSPVTGAPFSYTVDGNSSNLTGTLPGWTTETYAFTATSASTVLRFTSNSLPGPNYSYPHLDNVSVTAVPEPETYAMLLAGLGALGFLARRRRD